MLQIQYSSELSKKKKEGEALDRVYLQKPKHSHLIRVNILVLFIKGCRCNKWTK